jgi:hypothetical protein
VRYLGIVLILCLLIISFSCKDVESYSDIPYIELKSYKVDDGTDTLGNKVKDLTFEFSFVDGDGDLFSPLDSINRDLPTSKLHWIFYEKTDGVFVQIPDSLMKTPTYFHLPYSDVMERNGQNKTQKGTIKYNYQLSYPLQYDTLEIEFYVVDMAYHQSNIVRTSEAIILQ